MHGFAISNKSKNPKNRQALGSQPQEPFASGGCCLASGHTPIDVQ